MFFRITESFPYRYFIHVSKWDFFVCLFLEKNVLILFFRMIFFLFEIKPRFNVWYKNPERVFHEVTSFHSQRSKYHLRVLSVS